MISDQRLCLFGTILIIILDNTYCNVTLIDSSPVQYTIHTKVLLRQINSQQQKSGLTLYIHITYIIHCIIPFHLLSHSNPGYFLQWWVFHRNVPAIMTPIYCISISFGASNAYKRFCFQKEKILNGSKSSLEIILFHNSINSLFPEFYNDVHIFLRILNFNFTLPLDIMVIYKILWFH